MSYRTGYYGEEDYTRAQHIPAIIDAELSGLWALLAAAAQARDTGAIKAISAEIEKLSERLAEHKEDAVAYARRQADKKEEKAADATAPAANV